MGEVIRRLGLDINYSVDDGLKSRDLYTDSPVEISFPDSSFSQPAVFSVIPLPEGGFRIKGCLLYTSMLPLHKRLEKVTRLLAHSPVMKAEWLLD